MAEVLSVFVEGAAMKPKLGSGVRFRQLTNKLKAQGAKSPKGLAAYIGRAKFGASRMGKLSAAGRRRASQEVYVGRHSR